MTITIGNPQTVREMLVKPSRDYPFIFSYKDITTNEVQFTLTDHDVELEKSQFATDVRCLYANGIRTISGQEFLDGKF